MVKNFIAAGLTVGFDYIIMGVLITFLKDSMDPLQLVCLMAFAMVIVNFIILTIMDKIND